VKILNKIRRWWQGWMYEPCHSNRADWLHYELPPKEFW